MFSGGFRGQKLKTSLRLSINRLKLMEKKKTELAQKARKEIADYISMSKYDRARIRVEHIIREDYLVEAMELIELYCDLLLARFGLIESMKYCDEGLVESVSTIIWATPRLSTDCQELRTVSEQLILKYGKEFGQQARSNTNNTVNERLINKLSPDPPPKILVEKYLIEIARNYDVQFTPDPEVMMSEGIPNIDSKEFEAIGGGTGLGFSHYGGPNNGGGNLYVPPPGSNSGTSGGSGNTGGSGGGGGGDIAMPHLPSVPSVGAPSIGGQSAPYPGAAVPPYPGPASNMAYPPPHAGGHNSPVPPYPGGPGADSMGKPTAPPPGVSSLPDLPDIPTGGMPPPGGHSTVGGQSAGDEDMDFDDLERRFEILKKKK